mmetsp:Transcript_15214/g.12942  ORF Transcript_15214/g.12942 Transcript_15214/m.12942 type:complete len:146 (-) Transcript_15214:11-448(-)
MQPLFEPIPTEVKNRLQSVGFKPYRQQALSPMFDPRSIQRNVIDGICFFILFKLRTRAQKAYAPTLVYSIALVSIPLFNLFGRLRLDMPNDYMGHRKTLQERLKYSGLTAKAFYDAKKINSEYQTEMRREIYQLEKQLTEKGIEY